MAIAFVAVMIMLALVVAGFLVYGMFLGVARLSRFVANGYKWLVTQ